MDTRTVRAEIIHCCLATSGDRCVAGATVLKNIGYQTRKKIKTLVDVVAQRLGAQCASIGDIEPTNTIEQLATKIADQL